jgi:hypothetical protein
MYRQLESSAIKVPGFGKEGLKKQLFREYGVDVDVIGPVMDAQLDERRQRRGEPEQDINTIYADFMDKNMKEQ